MKWGVLRLGTALLVGFVVLTPLALEFDRREMAKVGVDLQVHLVDFVPFIPRLLLICFGGGAVFAVLFWSLMEWSRRRDQRRSAGA